MERLAFAYGEWGNEVSGITCQETRVKFPNLNT